MRLRTLVTSFILAALGCAPELASAQQPGQLTRITPTTGLADSSLFVCSDSTKALTRACKFSSVQQRLSFKAFDSLLTTKLNLTSGTITGSPTWSSTFVAATGQRVDSATGAARASGLVGNPAITVSSCTGCGGGTPQDSIRLKNGAASTPSLMFANSLTSGLYRFGADTIGVAIGGVNALRISGGATPIIAAGTGNSSNLTFKVTTNTGTITQALSMFYNTGTSDVYEDFTGHIRTSNNGALATPAFWFTSGNANSKGFYLTTNGVVDTINVAVNGIAQMKIGAASLTLPTLPSEGSTKNAMCWDGTTFAVTQNAAATCTVSSARFKENIVPVDAAAAWKIVGKSQLHSSTYNERVGGRKAIGIIAEQADSADIRLASRDAKGIITSTNYEEVTSLLLTVVKDQQRQLAFQQKMIDSLGRMVDTLFWKRGSLCNGKACKSEPEIPVHLVVKKVKPMRSANIEVVRDTSTTYTFPRARVVKDSAGVVQVKLLPSREP